MDREALILYLRNVRDLELARTIMERKHAETKRQYEEAQSQLHLQPQYQTHESKPSVAGGIISLIVCTLLSMVLIIPGILGRSVLMLILGLPGIAFGILLFCGSIASYSAWKKEDRAISEYNAEEDRRIPYDRASYQQNMQAWAAYDRAYQDEHRKLQMILDRFYDENLISQEHRGKLANIEYLYETASSTHLSYSDILLHGKLEDGIRRIEGSLNKLISVANSILCETHCLREEQNRAAQMKIEQDEKMLSQLKSASASASEAAQYSRLAANYAEANAWFSLANYLKY